MSWAVSVPVAGRGFQYLNSRARSEPITISEGFQGKFVCSQTMRLSETQWRSDLEAWNPPRHSHWISLLISRTLKISLVTRFLLNSKATGIENILFSPFGQRKVFPLSFSVICSSEISGLAQSTAMHSMTLSYGCFEHWIITLFISTVTSFYEYNNTAAHYKMLD